MHYEAGFVGIPPDHPFAARRRGRPPYTRSPWDRLAVARTLTLQSERLNAATEEARTKANEWQSVKLADPEQPIYLTEYLAKHDVDDVDFIKIDIDGNDYEVLNSLDGFIDSRQVLGLLMEVNYIGSADETEHTFHNTDRFMRTRLFDLFDLSVRRYAASALPSPYRHRQPGPTFGGRPLQGDALYFRDLASPDNGPSAARATTDKLLKLAGLFSLFDLPDCAAEVLVAFRDRLSGHLDVTRGLDLLALQSQRDFNGRRSYAALISAFDRHSGPFYSGRMWPVFHGYRELMVAVRTLLRRLRVHGRL